uniref:Amidase domain-containing protein n=1 Tax=Aegilops tauschii subsp. strangulata TaxID=200361 RepID=A0A452ZWF1_AEGTS
MVKPNLGPGIRERVQEAIAKTDESAMDDLHAVRTDFKSALATLLNEDVLAIPTVPGAPAKLGMDAALLENFRARAFSLLSIAGLSGFCQASIPLGTRCGIPVSVSLLARHGADRSLLPLPRSSRRGSKMRPPQPGARQ